MIGAQTWKGAAVILKNRVTNNKKIDRYKERVQVSCSKKVSNES